LRVSRLLKRVCNQCTCSQASVPTRRETAALPLQFSYYSNIVAAYGVSLQPNDTRAAQASENVTHQFGAQHQNAGTAALVQGH
jgi:hypothetical protein